MIDWQESSVREQLHHTFKGKAAPRTESDHFGNLLTNFRPDDMPDGALKSGTLKMQVNGKEVKRLVETFAQGEPGEPVALVGSSGFIEIAVNKGNAARVVGAGRGAAVVVTP